MFACSWWFCAEFARAGAEAVAFELGRVVAGAGATEELAGGAGAGVSAPGAVASGAGAATFSAAGAGLSVFVQETANRARSRKLEIKRGRCKFFIGFYNPSN